MPEPELPVIRTVDVGRRKSMLGMFTITILFVVTDPSPKAASKVADSGLMPFNLSRVSIGYETSRQEVELPEEVRRLDVSGVVRVDEITRGGDVFWIGFVVTRVFVGIIFQPPKHGSKGAEEPQRSNLGSPLFDT